MEDQTLGQMIGTLLIFALFGLAIWGLFRKPPEQSCKGEKSKGKR